MSLFLSNPQLNPAGLELPFTLLVLVSFSDPWLPLPAQEEAGSTVSTRVEASHSPMQNQYNTGMTDRNNFPK